MGASFAINAWNTSPCRSNLLAAIFSLAALSDNINRVKKKDVLFWGGGLSFSELESWRWCRATSGDNSFQ